jgi:hypothetical protein
MRHGPKGWWFWWVCRHPTSSMTTSYSTSYEIKSHTRTISTAWGSSHYASIGGRASTMDSFEHSRPYLAPIVPGQSGQRHPNPCRHTRRRAMVAGTCFLLPTDWKDDICQAYLRVEVPQKGPCPRPRLPPPSPPREVMCAPLPPYLGKA